MSGVSTKASARATSGRWRRHSPTTPRCISRVSIGSFVGRDAIAAAYRDQPPDDEVEISDPNKRDGMIVTRYAWRRDRCRQAGEMPISPRNAQIRKLVVRFD